MLLKHDLLWIGHLLTGAVAQPSAQGDSAWTYLVSHNSGAAAGMASYCKTVGVTTAADCNAHFLTPRNGNLPPSSVTASAANTCAKRAQLSKAEAKRITDLMGTDFNMISRLASDQSMIPDLKWKHDITKNQNYRLYYSIEGREAGGTKMSGSPIDQAAKSLEANAAGIAATGAMGGAGAGALNAAGGAAGVAGYGRTALTSGLLGIAVAALGTLDVVSDYWMGFMMPWLANVPPNAIYYEGDSMGKSIADGTPVVYDQATADMTAAAVERDEAESNGGGDETEEETPPEKDGDGGGGGDDNDDDDDTNGDGWDDDSIFNGGDLEPEIENSTPFILDETRRTSFQRCVEAEESKLWQAIGSVTIDPDAESLEVRKANALQQLSRFGICDTHVLGAQFCQDWKNKQAEHPIPPQDVDEVKVLVTDTHICVGSLLGLSTCKFLKEELWKRYVVRDEVAQVADGLFTMLPSSTNVRLPPAAAVVTSLGKKLLGNKAGAPIAGGNVPVLGSAARPRLPTRPITVKELRHGPKKGAGFIPPMGALPVVHDSRSGGKPFSHDEL